MKRNNRVAHPAGGKRIVQEQFAHENSVSALVSRHRLGASIVDPSATRRPIFGDFTAVDFQTMQDKILDVGRQFAMLPSAVRRKFGNQPYQLLRLVDAAQAGDASAVKQCKDLGLTLEKEPAPDPLDSPATKRDLQGLKSDPEANPHKKSE